jgi:lipoprotein-anchoring transpeptidase ErfK/SrfK
MSAKPSRYLCSLLFAGVLFFPGVPAVAQSLSLLPMLPYAPAQPQYAPQDEQQPGDTADGATADDELAAPLRRQVVSYSGSEPPGAIIIDTGHTFLYLTLGDGKAMRYGIGVGRQGFTWSGVETITRKAEWPDWIPPSEMVARQPYLPRWVAGGPGNPLGARALYLGNTDYRIHGTNDPTTIGKHVSSGCIRLQNADVIDLYQRVGVGTKVVVLPNNQGRSAALDNAQRVALGGGHGAPMTARIDVSTTADSAAPASTAAAERNGQSGIY